MTKFFWQWFAALGVVIILITGLVFWCTGSNVDESPVIEPVATSTTETESPIGGLPAQKIIGTSVKGRNITAYTYGSGQTKLLFVGGIHGGYEWNSVFLAYRMMDYLQANPGTIPSNVSVTIIPSANPDGLFEIVGVEGRFAVENVPDAANTSGVGRFNSNDVDLNRNFGCKWQSTSTWKGTEVNAGTVAFSEPEAVAIRDYVLVEKPVAAIFWHSAGNSVYASECEAGILPITIKMMNTYATAAKYTAVPSFDAYPITGDVEGWLASINIPAITVELSTHDTTDWDRNLAGTKAILEQFKE